MLRISFNLYSPFKGSPGYGKVLKARLDKIVYHFVLTGFWLYKRRVLLIELQKTINIFTHAEEIGLLFYEFYGVTAIRTFTTCYFAFFIFFNLNKLCFCIESLVRDTVPAFIFSFVDVTLLDQAVEDFFHNDFVALFCRTDKIIIRDIQLAP
ncbi:hypothetical protein D3C76_1144850 [compost metagenome]